MNYTQVYLSESMLCCLGFILQKDEKQYWNTTSRNYTKARILILIQNRDNLRIKSTKIIFLIIFKIHKPGCISQLFMYIWD